jgi:predicted O-linked N-acetylglucosamine transferase (SPINDLY family)
MPKQAPHHAKGHVTVACLNHSRKLSDDALRLFDSIAGSHEKVKFLLISNEKSQQNAELSFRQRAKSLKINFEHFEIRAFMPLKAFMSLGAEVDFVVDSFPTSGGTTTLHSLWMGLPIVALQSTISANNTTATMLAGLGLHSLIAHDSSEYKEIVCHLIKEPDQLDGLRLEVRGRLQSSPLMNYAERVRDLELFFEFAKEEWLTKNVHAGV